MQSDLDPDPIMILEAAQKALADGKTAFKKARYKIGAIMRRKREATGLSLRGMAELVKLSPAYVSDLECGLRPWRRELIENFTHHLT